MLKWLFKALFPGQKLVKVKVPNHVRRTIQRELPPRFRHLNTDVCYVDVSITK